ncbi:hypothetical protein HN587_02290 [Candidatus Woesearchaeota archaeon]|jgi:hypothetical protein|nr:hypothetical protein [Candidatus Woesearchaeota archaeon]
MEYLDKYDLHLLEHKSHVCTDCSMFEKRGDKCWFFWEFKKHCSQKDLF